MKTTNREFVKSAIEKGGMAGAFTLGAFCPICIPSIGAFLASAGLGFLVNGQLLFGLMIMFILFGPGGLSFSYFKEHKNPYPLILGGIGSFAVFGGRYLFTFIPLIYMGAVTFFVASVWNLILRKKRRSELTHCFCSTTENS